MTPITVLYTARTPDSEANPYMQLLVRHLDARETRAQWFTWRRAFRGSYNILHLQWPEHIIDSERSSKRAIKALLFAILLIRLKARNPIIIETVHNSFPHKNLGSIRRFLLRQLDSMVRYEVHLTSTSLNSRSRQAAVIPHGLYHEWYPDPKDRARPSKSRVTILTFGIIKKYKNIPQLIEAVSGVPSIQLRILGKPENESIFSIVDSLAQRASNVSMRLEHVSDLELWQELANCDAVVLPYSYFLNSGAFFLALSAKRPVIIPRSDSAVALRHEFGSDWVFVFDPPLTSEVLEDAIRWLCVPGSFADFNAPDRSWASVGDRHTELYRMLIDSSLTRGDSEQ